MTDRKRVEGGKDAADFEALIEKLKRAEQQAPPLTEAEALDEQEAIVLQAFLDGKLNLDEYHARDPKKDTLSPGEVLMPNLQTLERCLNALLGDSELARDLTQHEADHLREAIRLGFSDTKLLIRFFREAEGGIALRAAIHLEIPKVGDADHIRQALRIIIEAPVELSDTDKMQLGHKG